MALSLKTVKGVVHLMWSTPEMEAQWKIRPNMGEPEILETLERVIAFVRTQNEGGAPIATPTPTAPTDAPRIPMMSPASLSDAPAGGPPSRDGFSWDQFPTTVVPEHLAGAAGGAWEMIPPGEME